MGRARTSWLTSLTVAAMYRAAEPKPGAWSVTAMSLSMVLGMPTTRTSSPRALQAAYTLPQASMLPLPPLKKTYWMSYFSMTRAIAS